MGFQFTKPADPRIATRSLNLIGPAFSWQACRTRIVQLQRQRLRKKMRRAALQALMTTARLGFFGFQAGTRTLVCDFDWDDTVDASSSSTTCITWVWAEFLRLALALTIES